MKNHEILDYEEYYDDDEQEIYDHGFRVGATVGMVIGLIGITIITAVALYFIYN